jgi:protoporphyrinogen/coproporphyrinogen III oxidase
MKADKIDHLQSEQAMTTANAKQKTAIVVGGGLAGASAAYTLKRAGWQVKIIERNAYIGGRTHTVKTQGYVIDTAASGVATSYTDYFALAKEAGIADRIEPASPIVGIVRDGRIHELDMRRLKWSGLRTSLLSLGAKFGLIKLFGQVFSARSKGMLDYTDMGKAAPIDNESTATYALREFSDEINHYFCDPLVRAMTLANGDRISKVEFFSGVANILEASMCSMRGGQQSFADHLVRDIPVELDSTATQVRESGDQVEVSWRGKDGERTQRVDACVVACWLNTAVEICPDHRTLLEPLNRILRYSRAISVCVGASIKVDTPSFMVLLPAREEPTIATLFLEHNKCADRAPAGHSLMTAYIEVSVSDRIWAWSDEQIVEQTLSSLYRLFPEMRGKVDLTHVQRWSVALPLLQIGGFAEIGRLNDRRDRKERVQFAGDYLSAAGQNTAVAFGVEAARNLITHQSV